MDLEFYLILATFLFILYIAVRSGIHNHRGAGTILGIIFIIAGVLVSGIDGTLLILGGIAIFLISFFSNNKEEEENE